jgi:hypothetical protein
MQGPKFQTEEEVPGAGKQAGTAAFVWKLSFVLLNLFDF